MIRVREQIDSTLCVFHGTRYVGMILKDGALYSASKENRSEVTKFSNQGQAIAWLVGHHRPLCEPKIETRPAPNASGYILWGYHPQYTTEPIRLERATIASDLANEKERREANGWLTDVQDESAEPTVLRAIVARQRRL